MRLCSERCFSRCLSEKADLGEPTVLVVPLNPPCVCGTLLRVDRAFVLRRSLGEGVRRAGEVRGEFLGLKKKIT